jgi:hypothetical protein
LIHQIINHTKKHTVMTTLQKQFNEVQKEIEIMQSIESFGEIGKMFKETRIKNLEYKLSEIAMELTAERYANEY